MGLRDWFRRRRSASPAPEVMPSRRVAVRGFAVPASSYVRSFLAASSDRLAGDLVPYSTPRNINAELRAALPVMRARARHLAQNNDHARAFLRLVRRNIVGPNGIGVQLQARTADGKALDKNANARIEAAFAEWGKLGVCTVDGGVGRGALERLLVTQVATDGEVLVRLMRGWRGNRFRFALQLISADMLPEQLNIAAGDGQAVAGVSLAPGHDLVMGVERDAYKRPVAYWLRQARGSETSPVTSSSYVRVPADEVLHLFHREFVNQVRGVPWFFSGMRRLAMLGGYEEAELVASRIASSKMGFFTSAESDDPLPHDAEGENGQRITEAQPGVFDQLPPGVDFKEWNPTHPTDAFAAFTTTLLRAFSAGAGVSYSSLTGDLSSANYSSLRQGALDEREEWRVHQRWFVESLVEPVFETWLDHALMFGALPGLDPTQFERWHKPRFVARGWQWVDPAKEIAADEGAVRLGVKSRTQICAERGLDFEELLEQLAAERELAAQYGVDISGTPAPASSVAAAPASAPGDGSTDEGQENDDAQDRTSAPGRKLRSRRR